MLKDWKKISENDDQIVYQKNGVKLTINKPYSIYTDDSLWNNIVTEGKLVRIQNRSKTKEKAIFWAKKYMRSH